MTAEERRWLPSRRTFRVVAVVILAVVLFVSWRAIPRVPRRILIFSGPSGGAYHEYGEHYEGTAQPLTLPESVSGGWHESTSGTTRISSLGQKS